jgi:hypothetical protein
MASARRAARLLMEEGQLSQRWTVAG